MAILGTVGIAAGAQTSGIAASLAELLARSGCSRLQLDVPGLVREADLQVCAAFRAVDVGLPASPLLRRFLWSLSPALDLPPAERWSDQLVQVAIVGTKAERRQHAAADWLLWETPQQAVLVRHRAGFGCSECAGLSVLEGEVGPSFSDGRRALLMAHVVTRTVQLLSGQAADGPRAYCFTPSPEGVAEARSVIEAGGCAHCSPHAFSANQFDTESDHEGGAAAAPAVALSSRAATTAPEATAESVPSEAQLGRELAALELARLLATTTIRLVDVRSAGEAAIVTIAGSELCPLPELAGRIGELPWDREERIVVFCKSGVRSLRARAQLEQAGFKHVAHLRGGILAWIEDVEPHLPRY